MGTERTASRISVRTPWLYRRHRKGTEQQVGVTEYDHHETRRQPEVPWRVPRYPSRVLDFE
eukprot:2546116-Rhodomonas_salina.1